MPSNVLCWVLICIVVLGSACTSTTHNPTQQPLVSQTTTTAAHVVVATSTSTSLVDKRSATAATFVEPEAVKVIDVERQGWPLPSFAGMYPPHPEDGETPDPSWDLGSTGVLSIEPPCVYVTLQNALRYNVEGGVVDDGPYRIALSLPYPLVRLDDNGETLWFGNTPFVTGEWVSMTQHLLHKPTNPYIILIRGSQYLSNVVKTRNTAYVDFAPRHSLQFSNRCAADGFLRVGSLNRVDCAQPMERDATYVEERWCDTRDAVIKRGLIPIADPPTGDLSAPLLADLAPPPFDYMFAYHPDLESEVSELMGEPTETTGIFAIGSPSQDDYETERECVYLYVARDPTTSRGDQKQHDNANGKPLAIRLDMPYPQIRYDPNTQTIWNNDVGPISLGDRAKIKTVNAPDFNINGKQPHETIGGLCPNSNTYAKVIDIQPANQ
ncbi:MAG: hypothetical protein OXB90_11440 [Acidimicrobiaceae bacterium]|nr:hypothetical protein [Acidimicrobiaceae bacterium]